MMSMLLPPLYMETSSKHQIQLKFSSGLSQVFLHYG